jgi:hypothetical protein
MFLLAAGLVAIAATAVVVFGGGDKKTTHLIDPDPEDHGFHVTGIADNYAGPAPMKVHFAADAYHYTGTVRWFWRFDDGAVSKEKYPAHEFKQPGYYQVLVDGADDRGNVGRMNVLLGIWPRKLWVKAQSGAPFDRAEAVRKQWARTNARKRAIIKRCLANAECRKHELAARRQRRAEARREKAACRKDPQCVRGTRLALREARKARRAARRAGTPQLPASQLPPSH